MIGCLLYDHKHYNEIFTLINIIVFFSKNEVNCIV